MSALNRGGVIAPRVRRANAAIAAYRTGSDLRGIPVIGKAT
jgi:hypothetical protein